MVEARSDGRPPRGLRWRRILGATAALASLAGGAYAASWLNARRYFLVVDAAEVRVAKGRMWPWGHEPYAPPEPGLRSAYEAFPLPGGINLPRGESRFEDRVELDQALFRTLRDAIEYSLGVDTARTTELVARYLKQVKALPGTSVAQQLVVATLEHDAAYHDARVRLSAGVGALREAARLYRASAAGQGARLKDGELRARAIERALASLDAPAFGAAGPADGASVRTASTASSTVGSSRKVPE